MQTNLIAISVSDRARHRDRLWAAVADKRLERHLNSMRAAEYHEPVRAHTVLLSPATATVAAVAAKTVRCHFGYSFQVRMGLCLRRRKGWRVDFSRPLRLSARPLTKGRRKMVNQYRMERRYGCNGSRHADGGRLRRLK